MSAPRANIDHIAIAPSGVWVIDAKRYKGKVAVSRPLFGQPKLTINGRDTSKLVDGLAKQVALVKAVMVEVTPEVPVDGALCFVDADLPMVTKLSFGGYPLLYNTRDRSPSASTRPRRSRRTACELSQPTSRSASLPPERDDLRAGLGRPAPSVAWR